MREIVTFEKVTKTSTRRSGRKHERVRIFNKIIVVIRKKSSAALRRLATLVA